MRYFRETNLPELPPEASKLRVAQVASYLESAGWKQRPAAREKSICFESPQALAGEPVTWHFPDSEQYVDYLLDVQMLVNVLSVLEKRTADEVIAQLLSQPADSRDLASA